MKKIRLFALCGIIGCALLFIGTTTISKQKMEIGGFLANKYLPPMHMPPLMLRLQQELLPDISLEDVSVWQLDVLSGLSEVLLAIASGA